LLKENGFIVIADKKDLWIKEFLEKELGYINFLEQPRYANINRILSATAEMQGCTFGKVETISGKVPVIVFQKPTLSSGFKVTEISVDRFKEYRKIKQDKIIKVGTRDNYGFSDLSEEAVLVTMAAPFCIVPVFVNTEANRCGLGHFTYTVADDLETEEKVNIEFYKFLDRIKSDAQFNKGANVIYLFGGGTEIRGSHNAQLAIAKAVKVKENVIMGIKRRLGNLQIIDLTPGNSGNINRTLGEIMVGSKEGLLYYYVISENKGIVRVLNEVRKNKIFQ
jgi:hypothetical protein